MEKPPSRNRIVGEILHVHKGIAIYQTGASPYWFARIRDPRSKRYIVRSTKTKSRIEARRAAEELADVLLNRDVPVPRHFTFRHYGDRFLQRAQQQVASGDRNANYIRTAGMVLDHKQWGLLKRFGGDDVRTIKTRQWIEFLDHLNKERPDLTPSTKNTLSAIFRNVMKVAREEGVIDDVPDTPRTKQKDNPRTFFRFYPLVDKEQDTYKRLLDAAKDQAAKGTKVRGLLITDELYDLILFVVHSFVRPTTTELYALRHADVQVAQNPKRLLLTIRNGKTGYRIANTMPGAVSVYERIKARNPDAGPEDFLFLPQSENRATAARTFSRQFNHVLDVAGIKHDPFTDSDHTVYSLRHTAICMRIILSEGKVNIFNLAKTAGTSVEQIERFYARNLPLSAELARNLQGRETILGVVFEGIVQDQVVVEVLSLTALKDGDDGNLASMASGEVS